MLIPTLVCVIALLFISVGYAVTVDNIAIGGTVDFGGNLELRIVPINAVSGSEPGSRGQMTVSNDGRSASITAAIENPGDLLEFSFRIENTGGKDAVISNVHYTTPAQLALDGTFVNLKNVGVSARSKTNDYTIVLGWPAGENDVANSQFSFEIKIDYVAAK